MFDLISLLLKLRDELTLATLLDQIQKCVELSC